MLETQTWSGEAMKERVVRYDDLRPCYNAFVDTRTPGSDAKENFTIIGPGVSENPEQYLHIDEPHGFNIGGARQPPGCVNSQHSHDSAEVFVVHSGRWRFTLGEHGEDAQVELGPGDIINLPTHTFRGFTNVGSDVGFLWAVLGGDDPGRVLWAPDVFRLARDHGLILLESGRLVDTVKGERVPKGEQAMPATTPEQVAALRRLSSSETDRLVARATEQPDGERLLIGPAASLGDDTGFTLTRLKLRAAEHRQCEAAADAQVLFVHEGAVEADWSDGRHALVTGDTWSVPPRLCYTLAAGKAGATLFIVNRA